VSKTAIITGICGQDGPYLAQLLLAMGYNVVGTTRSIENSNTQGLRFLGIQKEVLLIEIKDFSVENLQKIIKTHQPTEIYNLAAQSSVGESFKQPIATVQDNVMSVLGWLEAIKQSAPDISFYQASSSEMYGNVRPNDLPIKEGLIFNPASPYGISKASAHWLAVNYREAHGLKAGCGILFNHESALRGPNYVIKKVLRQALMIAEGKQKIPIQVGNLSIERDWGYAPEYVKAMWCILQQNQLDDYHICSGTVISLNEFVSKIFKELNLDAEKNLRVDPQLYRPVDLQTIYGDNTKAKNELGWNYTMSTDQLVQKLIADEYKLMEWQTRN
jgi:GDPmannose 4,6-dehydratase